MYSYIKIQRLKKKLHLGFTLVELIVVITILVILGTIAFLNLNTYSGSVRDSARISNINNLKKGLDMFFIKTGIYPKPENNITISLIGTPVSYQGYAADTITNIAKLSKGGNIDPLTGAFNITYTTSIDGRKAQYLTFLEQGTNRTIGYKIPTLIPSVSAAIVPTNNTNFVPYTIGDSIGTILSSSGLVPLQDTTTGTGIDITSNSSGYTLYFNTTTTSNTGNLVNAFTSNSTVNLPAPEYSQLVCPTYTIGDRFSYSGITITVTGTGVGTASSQYTNCDTKDTTIWSCTGTPQIWAMCNVGATQVFNGTQNGANDNPIATEITGGKFFQWGESIAWDNISGPNIATNSSHNCTWNRDTQSCITGPGPKNSWPTTVTDTTTDGADRWNGTNNEWVGSNRGPCADKYHISTYQNWTYAYGLIVGTPQYKRDIMANRLKIPMFTNGLGGSPNGTTGWYWTSTPNLTFSKLPYIFPNSLTPNNFSDRTGGYSLRCVHD